VHIALHQKKSTLSEGGARRVCNLPLWLLRLFIFASLYPRRRPLCWCFWCERITAFGQDKVECLKSCLRKGFESMCARHIYPHSVYYILMGYYLLHVLMSKCCWDPPPLGWKLQTPIRYCWWDWRKSHDFCARQLFYVLIGDIELILISDFYLCVYISWWSTKVWDLDPYKK
jgi:hypothetical protein